MSAIQTLDLHFEKIARTIAGRPAHFELVTKDHLYVLQQGDLILSANGLIEDGHKFNLELGTFYSLIGGADVPQCFLQQRGILNFAKGELAAYKPMALFNKEKTYIRKDFIEPEFRSIADFYRFIEIVQQKAMLKMVYD